MARIDFFGLGEMGFAMAGHLARARHSVLAHDLDPERVRHWGELHAATRPDQGTEVLITSVSDLEALRLLMAAPDGLGAHLKPGMLWIDHTTTSPDFARECATFAAGHQAGFVDAPMSGGKAGAERGELTLFVGAEDAQVARARLICAPYFGQFFHLGTAGAGQAAKLAHQLAIAGTVIGLQAAATYGSSQGLAPVALLAALQHGTAQSAQLAQHHDKMSTADYDFHRSFAWLAKDLAALAPGSPALPILLQQLLCAPAPTES